MHTKKHFPSPHPRMLRPGLRPGRLAALPGLARPPLAHRRPVSGPAPVRALAHPRSRASGGAPSPLPSSSSPVAAPHPHPPRPLIAAALGRGPGEASSSYREPQRDRGDLAAARAAAAAGSSGGEAGDAAGGSGPPSSAGPSFTTRLLKPLRDFGFGASSFWEGGVGLFVIAGMSE